MAATYSAIQNGDLTKPRTGETMFFSELRQGESNNPSAENQAKSWLDGLKSKLGFHNRQKKTEKPSAQKPRIGSVLSNGEVLWRECDDKN